MLRVQKAERLFYIIKYLDNHETATAGELAKHCQTSPRSIYRDMKDLDNIGFYIINEGRKGYRLIHKPIQTPSHVTNEEWMALILFPLLSRDIAYEEHSLHLAYRSGLEKVGKNVQNNKSILPISSQIGERILFQDQYKETNSPDVMTKVIESIARNISIQVNYFSLHRNVTTKRMMDPYYLVPRGGHLYIIAFCHFREKIRVFRLNRMQSVQLTEQHFTIPKSFDILAFLANRWSIIADETEPITFSVKFSKEIARYIHEHDFYTATTLEQKEDGSLLLKTKVKSKIEFLKWVRSFGVNAEVIEPIEIREELRREYEQLLRRYEK